MIYLWPQSSSMMGMCSQFGQITRPSDKGIPQGIREGRWWACDNGAFTQGFQPAEFFKHLERLQPYRERCLFIVCPDVVGDALATLGLYHAWSDTVRQFGPIAFVAQDGQERLPLPEHDWLFIGGTTDWKMGAGADECIKRTDKPVHVGRVNSLMRFRHFQRLGVDSCDGTFPCFEPDTARRRLAKAVQQPLLHGWLLGGDSGG